MEEFDWDVVPPEPFEGVAEDTLAAEGTLAEGSLAAEDTSAGDTLAGDMPSVANSPWLAWPEGD